MAEEQIINQRKQKLRNLEEAGINPYPYSFDKKHNAAELQKEFSKLKKEEKTKKTVTIAGRVMIARVLGKISFFEIQDQTGRIQLYASKETLKDYNKLKKIDSGDFIGIKGTIFKTRTGEITINIKEFELLSKSIIPLPSKWHGLKDDEIRYRQRYLDLIANPEIKETFVKRAKIIKSIREFLDERGFMEVEIPTMQPIYGGANAKPFKTHINAFDMDLFLSISPELHLKRLLVGGFEKVYSLAKSFRNEGVDRTHNPEFTMMECYWAYADYTDMEKLTEELYEYVAKKVLGTTKIEYQGTKIDLKAPWKKISMIDALKKYGKIDANKLTDKQLQTELKKNNLTLKPFNRGLAINELFEELVEDKLIQPTFIKDHPKETTPLCKIHRKNPELIERFEPFINGWEIGNAYSELNNPIKQRELLMEQEDLGRGGDEEYHPLDEDFIRAIETGMPPAGGLGLGIDRLVMLLTNSKSIRDVILFPTMRPENE
ncbi:lysine--tRNA ligase [archaeon]|jgi:lysyl-tRNA synthetase, class II|nr:lysine--tRNA ligase [archaeon]